mmetsp:Transcript_17521/g.59170  ORF Transcript_17521/g.59170 Transcript_17521/m.59170 type:complete len:479 (+) Transcript_17521:95-1531(+)
MAESSREARTAAAAANVKRDASDFLSWQLLIAEVEGAGDAARLDGVLRNCLAHFPLVYGYWSKLAQLRSKVAQLRNEAGRENEAGLEEAVEVFEEALGFLGASVDLWLKYAALAGDARVLERAVEACALDPRVSLLFSALAQLEKEPRAHLAVLKRSLAAPAAEHGSVRAAVDKALEEAGTPNPAPFLQECGQIQEAAEAAYVARQRFESALSRPYYHNQPLSAAQLAAWGAYLDYEEEFGDARRVEAVFERCLIPCADYADFWVRYALWAAGAKGNDAASVVIDRASQYLGASPDVALLQAQLLEARGLVDEAREVYERVCDDVAPGLLEGALQFAHFERRQGDVGEARRIFEAAVAESDGAGRAHLCMHFAAFTADALRDVAGARAILEQALRHDPASGELLRAYFELECRHGGEDAMHRVFGIFSHALARPACAVPAEDQKALWAAFKAYVGDFGGVADVLAADSLCQPHTRAAA